MYIRLKRKGWFSYQLHRPMLIWKQYKIISKNNLYPPNKIISKNNKYKLKCFLVAIKLTKYTREE